jgi:hypothetical protein
MQVSDRNRRPPVAGSTGVDIEHGDPVSGARVALRRPFRVSWSSVTW